ncbi:LacI family DNA-binding transcriptional regulator [Streptomyces sp. 5-8]|uniref:LacI family DNA-binding transcriptional regulator n=1 Tax=Streptomyces musisoli TaxID=2802280 RepID=A0ABS1NT27_9ACTN|nr:MULTISPECIES: LacI family DNA-binding transcriptional regulator [Streptomyces]MBL1103124.1 LacI family DNA-binding transcriptional regulator [Streptomyces musisoli]MBY8840893.1 LacI family transcriptional regulator [Streptomyces sp. SP2-10]
MRPPTIRDVAERAGVSKSLVSLVLRGSGPVRPEKREAVLRAVRELGYRPNAAARSLSEQRSRTVGVVLDDLRNPWFVELLDGLNSLLHAAGLHMLLADARLNRRMGHALAEPFTDLGVDGLVVVGTVPDAGALGTLARRIPVVVAGAREAQPPGVDVVAGDDERGARLVTEHLLGLGHRRIAHLAGHGAVGALRRRGFETAMRAHGAEPLVEPGDLTEESGYRGTVRLLSRAERPTALFAVNDMAAVGALSAAVELGLGVPRDLSVAGYDNTGISRLRHVWLTTVDTAPYEAGRRAAGCLLDRLAGHGGDGGVQLAPPTLQVRGTTGPPDRPQPAGAAS